MSQQHDEPFSGIGIVILAAGASSRLGQPKQLLVLDKNITLIRKSVMVAVDTGFRPIVVVLGANKEKIQTEVRGLPVSVVENEAWQAGMGTSVKAGIEQLISLHPKTKAVILLLCDQPFINTLLLQELAREYQKSGKPIIASQYGGIFGAPALFDQQYFPQLMALNGDEGARKIFETHANMVSPVPFEEGKYDIDTMKDYQILKQIWNSSK